MELIKGGLSRKRAAQRRPCRRRAVQVNVAGELRQLARQLRAVAAAAVPLVEQRNQLRERLNELTEGMGFGVGVSPTTIAGSDPEWIADCADEDAQRAERFLIVLRLV
jgi:hypothetical protein